MSSPAKAASKSPAASKSSLPRRRASSFSEEPAPAPVTPVTPPVVTTPAPASKPQPKPEVEEQPKKTETKKPQLASLINKHKCFSCHKIVCPSGVEGEKIGYSCMEQNRHCCVACMQKFQEEAAKLHELEKINKRIELKRQQCRAAITKKGLEKEIIEEEDQCGNLEAMREVRARTGTETKSDAAARARQRLQKAVGKTKLINALKK